MSGVEERQVEVWHDGQWVRCDVEDRMRRADGSWRFLVRYTADVGSTFLHWRDESELREAPGG